ncbi:tail sheath protein [Halobacterium phage ChaoS9]|uniref:Tail sheath protein n=1 Tax=Halobacterium phage ChaoS9 TaxID=2847105 RepID=A0A481V9E1_9CAUD|nr:head protein [Halobacterium phage ChaoS9]QBI90023.1 tail sheath protein [Halobacterium phage ChaoS9]
MPTTVVDIDLTADIAARPRETLTDVVVIGTAADQPPGANFGELRQYARASEVSNDYGEDSDVLTTSEAIAEMGAQHWYVIVLEETAVQDENVDDGAAVENTPILGEVGVTADARDVVYSTETPPAAPNEGEVAVNTESGVVTTGDGTAATLSYSYVDWDDLQVVTAEGLDVAGLADVQAGRQHIGELNALATWADDADVGIVSPYLDARTVEDEFEAMQVAHDVGTYVQSGDLLTFVHKSDEDVGGYVLGQLARNDPWFDPFWDGEGYPFSSEPFRANLVGEPGEHGTFEGGDASNDGSGPTNVIIEPRDGTLVLSNSLTTAGTDSDFQFWDVARTQAFAARVVETALGDLRLQEDRIPFTDDGRTMISSEITAALSDYEGGADDPFTEVDVQVPAVDELSDDDRADRRWTGIGIDGTLSGNGHEFGLTLNVSI